MKLEPNFCKGSLILKKSLLDKLLSPINLTLCVPLINKPNKSLANVPEFPASIVTLLLILKLPSPFPVIEHTLLLKVIFTPSFLNPFIVCKTSSEFGKFFILQIP